MKRKLAGQGGWERLRELGAPLHGTENTEQARRALLELADELLWIRNRNGEHVKLVPNGGSLRLRRGGDRRTLY